jgi:hypothetical protein
MRLKDVESGNASSVDSDSGVVKNDRADARR